MEADKNPRQCATSCCIMMYYDTASAMQLSAHDSRAMTSHFKRFVITLVRCELLRFPGQPLLNAPNEKM